MQLISKKKTLKSFINRVVRRASRVQINIIPVGLSVKTVSEKVTIQREIYANKEIIKVYANIDSRFLSRI